MLKHEGTRPDKILNVTTDAYEIAEVINEAETDTNMEEVRTMISTIVSFGRPNHN